MVKQGYDREHKTVLSAVTHSPKVTLPVSEQQNWAVSARYVESLVSQ